MFITFGHYTIPRLLLHSHTEFLCCVVFSEEEMN